MAILTANRCKCGRAAVVRYCPDLALSGNDHWFAWVECACGLRGTAMKNSEHRAIKSWNELTDKAAT